MMGTFLSDASYNVNDTVCFSYPILVSRITCNSKGRCIVLVSKQTAGNIGKVEDIKTYRLSLLKGTRLEGEKTVDTMIGHGYWDRLSLIQVSI